MREKPHHRGHAYWSTLVAEFESASCPHADFCRPRGLNTDSYVHADETTLRVQAKVQCLKGWVWVVLCKQAIAYVFDESRSGDVAACASDYPSKQHTAAVKAGAPGIALAQRNRLIAAQDRDCCSTIA